MTEPYPIPSGHEIRSMRRMELEQHLRLAAREIHRLSCEIERLRQQREDRRCHAQLRERGNRKVVVKGTVT